MSIVIPKQWWVDVTFDLEGETLKISQEADHDEDLVVITGKDNILKFCEHISAIGREFTAGATADDAA